MNHKQLISFGIILNGEAWSSKLYTHFEVELESYNKVFFKALACGKEIKAELKPNQSPVKASLKSINAPLKPR